jgi:hypothetical protein
MDIFDVSDLFTSDKISEIIFYIFVFRSTKVTIFEIRSYGICTHNPAL